MTALWTLLLTLALAVDVGAPEAPEAPPEPIEGVTPAGTAPASDDVERVARQIGLGLRCPVCQGLSAADSTSPAAINMQRRIRELVAQGYTREQIEAYFVSRYGEWVLLAPTTEGLNQVVWVGPAAALVVALGTALLVVGRRRDRTENETSPAPTDVAIPDDPYARALLADAESEEVPS